MSNRASGSDVLGRYYTRSDISSFLIEQFDVASPVRLLDLGAGSGSLSGAAKLRWPDVKILTVDIDPKVNIPSSYSAQSLSELSHEHFMVDALCEDLISLLDSVNSPIDVAVCNPPFITPKWRGEFEHILKDAGFDECMPFPVDVDAGMLFLAQNLRLMSENATLGIILPDSLITSKRYKKFRSVLLDRYTVIKVIQLPRGAFHNTDALASIVIIKKAKKQSDYVHIFSLSKEKKLSKPLFVDVRSAVERLDYCFHLHRMHECYVACGKKSVLNEVALEIRRGSLSSSQIKNVGFPVLHITDIKENNIGSWLDLRHFEAMIPDGYASITKAQPGDILISRVGRNLESKIIGVKAGVFPISDCIYLIRCLPRDRNVVLEQLASQRGRAWISAHAYGVAAKQLAKKELMLFPVFLSDYKDA